MNKKLILKEYDKRSGNNEKLISVLKPLIKNFLNSHKILFQSIHIRLKSRDSLEKNFLGNKYKKKILNNFNDIPDIVGCRVIFYSEKDLNKFTKLIRNNFPQIGSKNKMFDEGYKGYNITCTLGNERKQLAEYSEISDITFEIQATTVFFHGWNELEHDIFYKDKRAVEKNFPRQFEELKEISKGLSKKLSDIQNAWEDIIFQYKKVAKGEKVFTTNAFKECARLSDNNQIYTFISRLNSFISENGSLPANLDIKIALQQIVLIIKKAIVNKVIPEKTVFGTWAGKTSTDIVTILLDTFSYTFYKDVDNTIKALTNVYALGLEKYKIEEWFKEIAEYKHSILKKQGYIVQVFFLDLIEQWITNNQRDLYDLVFPILGSILESDFNGSIHSDYKTIQFQRGSLHGDKNIKKIRAKALSILIRLYQKLRDVEQQLKIVDTFDTAMRMSTYGGTIDKVIRANIRLIARFYCTIFNDSSMKVLAKMEESLLWAQKRFPNETFRDIKIFFKLLDSNKEYGIYRVLVGYDGRIRLRGKRETIEEDKAIRIKRVREFSKEINDKNIKVWEKRLVKIGKNADKYGLSEGYMYFYQLLERVGKNNHKLAWRLIKTRKFKGLKEFLLAGLTLSRNNEQKSVLDVWVEDSIKKGVFLYEIIRSYTISGIYTRDDLKTILEALTRRRNKNEKSRILWELVQLMNFESRYKSLILDALVIANDMEYYRWTDVYIKLADRKKDFFASLRRVEWKLVKETLINKNKIGYNDEQILERLIKNFPKDFVEIFEQRILKKSRMKYDRGYDAIPHKMYYLEKDQNEVLEKNNEVIINKSFEWLNKEYSWYFGIFLKTVYPNQNQYLEKRLNEIIDLNDKKKWIKYVLPYLRWKQGFEIEKYVKRTVIKLDKDTEIWDACAGYLLNTGGISGNLEDSIIGNAYREILDKIKKWKTTNKKLKEFKERCIKNLIFMTKQADTEHCRTLQSMKRQHPTKSK